MLGFRGANYSYTLIVISKFCNSFFIRTFNFQYPVRDSNSCLRIESPNVLPIDEQDINGITNKPLSKGGWHHGSSRHTVPSHGMLTCYKNLVWDCVTWSSPLHGLLLMLVFSKGIQPSLTEWKSVFLSIRRREQLLLLKSWAIGYSSFLFLFLVSWRFAIVST